MNHILSEYFTFYLQIDFNWNACGLYFCMSLWYNNSLWEWWGSSIQSLELVSCVKQGYTYQNRLVLIFWKKLGRTVRSVPAPNKNQQISQQLPPSGPSGSMDHGNKDIEIQTKKIDKNSVWRKIINPPCFWVAQSISCIYQVEDCSTFDIFEENFLLKLKGFWYHHRSSWICFIDFKSSFEANFWTVFTNWKTVFIYIISIIHQVY